MSLLNGSVLLLENKFAQEAYVLGRAIEEVDEEIRLILQPALAEEFVSYKERLLNEFFQEQYDHESTPLKAHSRDRVPRKNIRNALARSAVANKNPHQYIESSKLVYEVMSSYAHGAYPCVIELFNPSTKKFDLHGSNYPEYLDGCVENFANNVYRSSLSAMLIANQLGTREQTLSMHALSKQIAEETGILN